jgi:anaerobic selenocysteine-containing dehydrogenase
MPDTMRVKTSFKNAGFTVYFGLYENETSRAADLVIPAKTFLEKNDFRSSYGDYTFQEMPRLTQSEIGISEYQLTSLLCETFGVSLECEEYYLNYFRTQIEYHNGVGYRQESSAIPYEEGFKNGEFEFLDEIDLDIDKDEGFYLITPKYAKGLNSQFKRAEGVYLHPQSGFEDGEIVRLFSPVGTVEMAVHHDKRLRHDCLLIYSGTCDVNVLTPSHLSYEGESAVYQEYKIKVTKK